jgi:hypothetical protein
VVICPIEYLQFGTAVLVSKQSGDMGVPRKGDYVTFLNERGNRDCYEVRNVEWYEDPNDPRVFVYLSKI